MSTTVGILALLFLLALLLLVGRRKQQPSPDTKTEKPNTATKSTPFHAVSMKLTADSCTAAKDLAGKRFLSADAPALPLRECNAANCDCRFVHHGDRRHPNDRRSPFSANIGEDSGKFEQEQRENRNDRRHDSDDDLF